MGRLFGSSSRVSGLFDYQYALDESSIVVITDLNGTIRHVNDNFCLISQYKREELLGKSHGVLNSGHHSKEFIRTLWSTITHGKIWKGELLNKAKDGSLYWVDTTIVPSLGDKGQPHHYIAIQSDITKRKKTEAQRELLASIIDSSDEAIISVDLDMSITSWNIGASRLFGYSADEVIGRKVRLIIPEDRVDEEIEILQEITHGGSIEHYETERRRKDGSHVHISLNVSPLKDSEGRIVGAAKLLRNITERKQARKMQLDLEEAVRATKAELAGVFERITDGFIVLDKDLRYTYANNKIGEMIGRTPASLIGKLIWEEFPDAVGSATFMAFQKALDEQRYVTNVDYYPPLDLWQENHIYPGPEGLSIFIRDITGQKRSERKIRESQEIYKTIASNIPRSAICLVDPEYRYLLAEGDMFDKIGYPKEIMVGRKVKDVMPPSTYSQLAKDFDRVFRGETFSVQMARKGYDLISRYVPLRDKDGRVYAAMVVSIDVTELKDSQRRIAELNANLELRVADRTRQLEDLNRELEAFTYSVSHDLRAPLRIVDGYADILQCDYSEKLDQEGRNTIEVIRGNTRRMGDLIDDLLNLSRLGRQVMSRHEVDMNKVLQAVLEEQLPIYKGNPPEVTFGKLAPACCDGNLIRQVWANLVGNGLKYAGKRDKPTLRINSREDPGMVVYSVADNGVGFDMKYAHKLFGIFQRLHKIDEFEGTGVGLALVQRIISRHGGKVWAEAEPNKGATFYFSLPANGIN